MGLLRDLSDATVGALSQSWARGMHAYDDVANQLRAIYPNCGGTDNVLVSTGRENVIRAIAAGQKNFTELAAFCTEQRGRPEEYGRYVIRDIAVLDPELGDADAWSHWGSWDWEGAAAEGYTRGTITEALRAIAGWRERLPDPRPTQTYRVAVRNPDRTLHHWEESEQPIGPPPSPWPLGDFVLSRDQLFGLSIALLGDTMGWEVASAWRPLHTVPQEGIVLADQPLFTGLRHVPRPSPEPEIIRWENVPTGVAISLKRGVEVMHLFLRMTDRTTLLWVGDHWEIIA